MNRNPLIDIILYFFIFLFFYTGIIKLVEFHAFQEQLSSSPLFAPVSGILGRSLPIGEILLALALLFPQWQLRGLYVTLLLMSAYAIYVIVILSIDDQLTISYVGLIENLSPIQQITFNSACAILSGIGILIIRHRQPAPRFQWLTGGSAVGLLSIMGWILLSAFTPPAVKKTGMEGRPIPSINLLLADNGSRFRTDDIPSGKSFVIIGFSPWRIRCMALTQDIKKQIAGMKNTKLYFITSGSTQDMNTFYNSYKLSNFPDIIVARDSANILFQFFKTRSTPIIAIYDKQKRLKKFIDGQITASRLAQMLDN